MIPIENREEFPPGEIKHTHRSEQQKILIKNCRLATFRRTFSFIANRFRFFKT